MSNLNEKKSELQDLDNDLRRLRSAVQQFDDFETSGKVIFLGLGIFLNICGIAAIAASYFLAHNSNISMIFSLLIFAVSIVFIFFGTRLVMIYFKLWNTLRRTEQIIDEVKDRKNELEREISLFAE